MDNVDFFRSNNSLESKKASEVDEEGQHYYPRICIIVVGILFVSIIFLQ